MADEQDPAPNPWQTVKTYEDILFEKTDDGIAKITINRPEVRNAFRPQTVQELLDAFDARARGSRRSASIILTGAGDKAFCSGRRPENPRRRRATSDEDGVPRLNVLDLQKQIRALPKPVIAMVAGYAIGGGHVLHIVCDLTIAADNARFGQTGPKVGSFDGGLGSQLPRAHRRPEEGARNLVPLPPVRRAAGARHGAGQHRGAARRPRSGDARSGAARCSQHSPLALRCLKSALNADCDGQMGLLDLAGNATLLYYMSEEAQEGKKAFLEKRKPDFKKFPRLP